MSTGVRLAALAVALLVSGCWAEVFLPAETDTSSTSTGAGESSTAGATTEDMVVNETEAAISCDAEEDFFACDGECVSLEEDDEHCGDCGVDCSDDELCSGGHCVFNCDCDPIWEVCDGESCQCREGTELCAGECVPLINDWTNCGGCGVVCEDVCLDFNCEPECFELEECGGACSDFDLDPLNCGGCGLECGSEQLCAFGTCRDVEPAPLECDECPCNDYCENLDLGMACCFSSVWDRPVCLDSPICPE